MSNAIITLVILGVAGFGIAYFSNMLCEPLKLCYNPIPASATPEQYSKGIAGILGVDMPEVPKFTGEQPRVPVGAIQDVLRQAGITPKLNIPGVTVPIGSGGGGGGPIKSTPAHLNLMASACKKKSGPTSCWSDGLGMCVPCGSTAAFARNFAEAESYAVRVA